jgi:CheY-like chemotaxis protein/signal transduction histidine kinase
MIRSPCVLAEAARDARPLADCLDELITCAGCKQGGCGTARPPLGQALLRLHQAARELRQLHSKLRQSQEEVEILRADLAKQEPRVTDLEQLHRKSTEELEAATMAKGQFLANMSHEIRTPLNAVLGMSGLLLDTNLSPRQQEFVETIRTSGSLLLSIINDILDFSKLDAGRLDLEHAPFDLCDVIASAFSLVYEEAGRKQLDFAYEIAAGTPAVVAGDAFRLQQVLGNLLSNAVKFTERGEVTLLVRATGPVAAGAATRLEVSVCDTGIGIPTDRRDRLFKAFSQVDASTTRRFGGTGLGLAITKELVTRMGGQIDIESEPGKGSTFRFTILVDVVHVERPASERSDAEVLAGRRVLVVDDNQTNRRILSRLTETWAMQTRGATSGPHALEILTAGEPLDVAIIDLHMPGMDGRLLARTIRQLESHRAMRLVLLTSAGVPVDPEMGGLFSAILHKPVHPRRLQQALVEALRGEPSTHAAAERVLAAPPSATDMATRHPLRILIAEDNPINQRVLQMWLERHGYTPDVVGDGAQAVQAVIERGYDVVFMDVQMPVLDGIAATRKINEALPSTRPRIVALSAATEADDRAACLAAGMAQFLAKPLQQARLVDALEQCEPTPVALRRPPPSLVPKPHEPGALSILVAEDNLVNQQVTRLLLERLGHQCSVVANGREAVQAVANASFDLVLMDCHMPVLDGYQATTALRASETGRRLPIVALTAQRLPGDRERCLATGMDGYLPKPIDGEQLSTEIARVLQLRSAPERPRAEDVPLWAGAALEQLRQLDGAGASVSLEIMELFRTDSLRIVAALRSAVSAGDRAAISRLGHELDGAASVVGAARLIERTRALGAAAKTGDVAALSSSLTALVQVVEETHDTLAAAFGEAGRATA